MPALRVAAAPPGVMLQRTGQDHARKRGLDVIGIRVRHPLRRVTNVLAVTGQGLAGAQEGNPLFQLMVGLNYLHGTGVRKDVGEAMTWFRKAAEQGNPDAQQILGEAHVKGFHVRQDYREGAEWLQKAAEQDKPKAQVLLGALFGSGRGVPRNDVLAYAWISIAVANGLENGAAELRDMLAKKLTPSRRLKAQELSARMWEEIKARSQLREAATGGDLSGNARVLDGDTLDVRGQRVRLQGIDAPERKQLCQDDDGAETKCGVLATVALKEAIGGQPVRCEIEGERGRYGRAIGVCFSHDGIDLNGWMVRHGWAVAYRGYSERYVDHERAARLESRGIHSGTFVLPWHWRRGIR